MITAQQKRGENIAEYLLYMWQVEDILRALNFEEDKIHSFVYQGYQLPEEALKRTEEWYQNLSVRMQEEKIQEKGHLKELQDLMVGLQLFVDQLLKMPAQTLFSSLYYATLPSIVQLREHAKEYNYSEVEACLVGVYGYLTLKRKGKEVSEQTLQAVKQFSTFLAMLSDRFQLKESGKLVVN